MSCSQLLVLNSILTPDKVNELEQYFVSLSNTARNSISATAIKNVLGVNENKTMEVIQLCVQKEILKLHYSVKCPECGHLIKKINSIDEIKLINECYACDELIEITKNDIVVLYELNNEISFYNGQQILRESVQSQFAALDMITASWIMTNLIDDFGNKEFFSEKDNKKKQLIKKSRMLNNEIVNSIIKIKKRNRRIIFILIALVIIFYVVLLYGVYLKKIDLFTNDNISSMRYILGVLSPVIPYFVSKFLFPIGSEEIRDKVIRKYINEIQELQENMDELNVEKGYRIEKYGVV